MEIGIFIFYPAVFPPNSSFLLFLLLVLYYCNMTFLQASLFQCFPVLYFKLFSWSPFASYHSFVINQFFILIHLVVRWFFCFFLKSRAIFERYPWVLYLLSSQMGDKIIFKTVEFSPGYKIMGFDTAELACSWLFDSIATLE